MGSGLIPPYMTCGRPSVTEGKKERGVGEGREGQSDIGYWVTGIEISHGGSRRRGRGGELELCTTQVNS